MFTPWRPVNHPPSSVTIGPTVCDMFVKGGPDRRTDGQTDSQTGTETGTDTDTDRPTDRPRRTNKQTSKTTTLSPAAPPNRCRDGEFQHCQRTVSVNCSRLRRGRRVDAARPLRRPTAASRRCGGRAPPRAHTKDFHQRFSPKIFTKDFHQGSPTVFLVDLPLVDLVVF